MTKSPLARLCLVLLFCVAAPLAAPRAQTIAVMQIKDPVGPPRDPKIVYVKRGESGGRNWKDALLRGRRLLFVQEGDWIEWRGVRVTIDQANRPTLSLAATKTPIRWQFRAVAGPETAWPVALLGQAGTAVRPRARPAVLVSPEYLRRRTRFAAILPPLALLPSGVRSTIYPTVQANPEPQRARILYPNGDLCLSPRPTLLWSDISYAVPDTFLITIADAAGKTLWERTVPNARPDKDAPERALPWPSDMPPLAPGGGYRLIVQPRRAENNVARRLFARFDVATPDDARRIEAELAAAALSDEDAADPNALNWAGVAAAIEQRQFWRAEEALLRFARQRSARAAPLPSRRDDRPDAPLLVELSLALTNARAALTAAP